MKTTEYHKLPLVVWDGRSPLYSIVTDRFYNDLSEVESDLEEGWSVNALMLMPTRPVYVRPLDSSYCEDGLPEDGYGELPVEVERAMDAFNKAVEGIVLSWEPIHKRLRFSDEPISR